MKRLNWCPHHWMVHAPSFTCQDSANQLDSGSDPALATGGQNHDCSFQRRGTWDRRESATPRVPQWGTGDSINDTTCTVSSWQFYSDIRSLDTFYFLPTVTKNSKIQFSSVAQSFLTFCDSMDSSMPGLPVHHQLPELTQTHVHWVGDATQPSHPLSSPSPPAFNLSQHHGLFQWVSSSHQVAKVLELQLQHQSFQWTFRTDFL